MRKVTGIKSVDFKVIAKGHGAINWNGATALFNQNGDISNNHMLPKLRGYSSLSGRVKEGTGFKYPKNVQDFNFSETPLYVSQNCIRHHLFKDQGYDLHFAGRTNMEQVLASVTGLLRGFVIPSTQWKKTSPLLIEDFVDQLHNGNYEQFATDKPMNHEEGKNGEEDTYKRGSDTLYSKTTFGDTEYIAYGSISVEELQFISLDPKFDRCAMAIKTGQGEEVAQKITAFIESLNADESLKPQATFHANYCRIGSIFDEGEAGILLNDDAVTVMVNEMIERIETLFIRQAKGYLYVDELMVDYNDSKKPMRIKRDEFDLNSEKEGAFAAYFEGR